MILDERLFCGLRNQTTSVDSVSKSVVIALISAAIIGGNVICLIVLNSRWTRGFFMESARMLMTSLACTDCTMGITVTSLCIYPALYGCWPYGRTVCKLQALCISSLFHESTLSLTLVAVDRYISIFHPLRYRLLVTRQKVIVAIVLTWFICFSVYGITIFGFDQFYYDQIGVNCEPFYQNPSITATVMSLFYFTPAVIMMVCYLRILTVAMHHRSGGTTQSSSQSRPVLEMRKHYGRCSQESIKNSLHTHSMGSRRSLNLKATKTLGLITIGFFVAVTPWTVTQLVMTLGHTSVHPVLDFTVTWLALSNSFWNVIIYCLTSTSFRLAAAKLFCKKQLDVRRAPVQLQRVELLIPRSTVVDSTVDHSPEEWNGKRKSALIVNGCGRGLPGRDKIEYWRIRNKRHSATVIQCKRKFSDGRCVHHSSPVVEHIVCSVNDDVISQDSVSLIRTHKRRSPRLQDCLCHRTESAPNIPTILPMMPLAQNDPLESQGPATCSISSDSEPSRE